MIESQIGWNSPLNLRNLCKECWNFLHKFFNTKSTLSAVLVNKMLWSNLYLLWSLFIRYRIASIFLWYFFFIQLLNIQNRGQSNSITLLLRGFIPSYTISLTAPIFQRFGCEFDGVPRACGIKVRCCCHGDAAVKEKESDGEYKNWLQVHILR